MKRIIIIGGGISGLAAAHRLHELSGQKQIPLDIKLLEATPHLGGVISTIHRDGFLLEGGPDAFISEKPAALALCRRLGLEGEVIGTQPEHRRSYVVRKKKLMGVPDGFYLTAPVRVWPFLRSNIFSWPGKLRMGMELFIPPRRAQEDESVASFIRRRFGSEAFERIGQAMTSGIYASDPEKLSLQASFPQFYEMEKKYGSVTRALQARKRLVGSGGGGGDGVAGQAEKASGPRYSLFLTLRYGMQSLADALARKIKLSGSIELNAPVKKVTRSTDDLEWAVEKTNGEVLQADAVIVAIPAPRMAALMESMDSDLASELGQIQYSTVGIMNVAYPANFFREPVQGFGFVAPEQEGLHITGCTFASQKFEGRAPRGHVLLRVFIADRAGCGILEWSRAQIEATVKQELGELLGIQGAPLFTVLERHLMSMPQYIIGHCERVRRIEEWMNKHSGLYLGGNALRGIGIPDCVRQAEEIAERILS